jgi:hypothetical protein
MYHSDDNTHTPANVDVTGNNNFVAGNDLTYQASQPVAHGVPNPNHSPTLTPHAGAGASAGVSDSTSVKIKSSSLSYLNAAGRVGFDFNQYYNDFTNEGHIYPLHGVGDLDTSYNLLTKFIKSKEGRAFEITDLGIDIQVTDDALINNNCFFDFHTIPTKILDGSTKLPDGSRIESHIPYFTGKNHSGDDCAAQLDWISGSARLLTPNKCFTNAPTGDVPTSLASTRDTPFLEDTENLQLTFFMDGKQARLTNGGSVSNWRYVVPLGMGRVISWFVAQAMRPCGAAEADCETITTTNGLTKKVKPRTASETEDLNSIANEPRYMKTVSESVEINAPTRAAAFNQRYGEKCVDFGDIILKDEFSTADEYENGCDIGLMAKIKAVETKHDDKQVLFYEMLKVIKNEALSDVYIYDTANLTHSVNSIMRWFIARYLNTDTYNISPKALVTKALKPPEYMWTPVCETGWLVVDEKDELPVPNDGGEYFIGWVIETQPMFEPPALDPTIRQAVVSPEKLQWLSTHGYALHQGPGLIYQTCGDFAHVGTQEPYILEYNYPAEQQLGETDDNFQSRKKSQEPTVHWRLDQALVIRMSLQKGAVTQANVGAGQLALASIGTKTPVNTPSRSRNFLGQYYQKFLSNRTLIREICANDYQRPDGAVYTCVNSTFQEDRTIFRYGHEQQLPSSSGYSGY